MQGPDSSVPSKPLYAAAYRPLVKTAVELVEWSNSGEEVRPLSAVPTTQCRGHDAAKSGLSEKWSPGSMWKSFVATTWS